MVMTTDAEAIAADMAHAFSDLNMAGAIQVLCESSLFRTEAGREFEAKISRLCRQQMQTQLHAYDRARRILQRSQDQ